LLPTITGPNLMCRNDIKEQQNVTAQQ